MERLMTIDEVADYLRVPVLTVRWLRQDGRFAPAIKVGRRLVWQESTIIAWAEKNTGSGRPEMSIQRYVTRAGRVRYRARVKAHGREVATRVFDRKGDAVAWEQDQLRGLRIGEWIDPRRGRVPLDQVAVDWLESRGTVKRRSKESDESSWRLHVKPRLRRPTRRLDHPGSDRELAGRPGQRRRVGLERQPVPRHAALAAGLRGRGRPDHRQPRGGPQAAQRSPHAPGGAVPHPAGAPGAGGGVCGSVRRPGALPGAVWAAVG